MLIGRTPPPEEVFTPRNPEVNERMYIERSKLERDLQNALKGNQHIIIHGESGTGKSWLYKRVFALTKTHYEVGNLANASRFKGIAKELENLVDRKGDAEVTEYTEEKSAGASAGVFKGDLKHSKKHVKGRKEPFERCLEAIRKDGGSGPAVLVLDNLESIFDSADLMNELADLVILLDDPRYAKYRVRLLLVGIPHGVRDYFNRTKNRAPVANRLVELPEVSRLSDREATSFINRGFVDVLKYAFGPDARSQVTYHIPWVTDRIPQRLHEYCLHLAYLAQQNANTVTTEMFEEADRMWLSGSLSLAYGVIERLMNKRDAKVGRRNQTLYVLGRIGPSEFHVPDVEALLRSHFPSTTFAKTLNVSGTLSDLSKGEAPLLRRAPNADGYIFMDPVFRMCLRAMLRKRGESVTRVDTTSI